MKILLHTKNIPNLATRVEFCFHSSNSVEYESKCVELGLQAM